MKQRVLLLVAAVLSAAATFLPLWGMTLVSTQYPEGLRMIVYPSRITGDIDELNTLNHYIGMPRISNDFFHELRVLPLLFAAIAVGCLLALVIRRAWVKLVPLAVMAGVAAYGFWSMHQRLFQFGHQLDPRAAIHIAPFTPPMLGENQIAQFATYSYFSWGTFLPLIAGGLVIAALVLDLRQHRAPLADPLPAPRPAVA